MCKIDFIEYHSNKRNGNPPRMWSNTSKIGFAMIYDTFRTWDFSPVLYRRHLGYGYGLAIWGWLAAIWGHMGAIWGHIRAGWTRFQRLSSRPAPSQKCKSSGYSPTRRPKLRGPPISWALSPKPTSRRARTHPSHSWSRATGSLVF